MKVTKVYDAADGSATPGEVFTASIGNRNIIPSGAELSFMTLGLKGAVATAAVVIEDFADLLSEYVFYVGSETRIKGSSQDLIALSAFFYGTQPLIGENTDATGNDFIGGVKIPVYQKVDAGKPFSHASTRTAVTNIATETIAMSAWWDVGEANRKPISAVRINHTTAASAGMEQLAPQIAANGNLIGLIFNIPNGYADGNIDTSIQRIKLMSDGVVHSEFNPLSDFVPAVMIDVVTPNPMADLLRPYFWLDLRPMGIDGTKSKLTLALDVQDVSDAIGIIPVVEVTK